MGLDVTGIGEVAGAVTNIVNKIWPDASEEQKNQLAAQLAQLEVNKQEAASTNWFVAGWRPFIGWVCGAGLAYSFLAYPLLHVAMPTLQQLDSSTLMTCLGGMLGIGGLRTVEKVNKVAR